MQADRAPSIIPLDFRVEYIPQADGSLREIEVVEYTRKGSQGATTPARIEHLQRLRDGQPDPLWAVLKPYYDNWKAGKAAPIDGTPLAAWPGATPQLVKALEPFHIRSVEDLAKIDDNLMGRISIPGIRALKNNAAAYVEAQKTTAVVAGEIATLRSENEMLKSEISELKDLIKSIGAKEGVEIVDEPVKRGPGRPRKVA